MGDTVQGPRGRNGRERRGYATFRKSVRKLTLGSRPPCSVGNGEPWEVLEGAERVLGKVQTTHKP